MSHLQTTSAATGRSPADRQGHDRETAQGDAARLPVSGGHVGRRAGPPPSFLDEELYARDARFPDGVTGDVVKEVRRTMSDLKSSPHVILLLTHQALLSGDLAGGGWQLVIDEMPQVVQTGTMLCQDQHVILERYYALETSGFPGFARLKPKAIYTARFIAQRGVVGLDAAHSIWSSHVCYVPITVWSECAELIDFRWIATVDENKLLGWDSVLLLANAAEDTASMIGLRALCPQLVWHDITPPAGSDGRTWKPRRVSIRYFARDHRATISSWRGVKGGRNLHRVLDHLAENLPDDSIWTVNREFRAAAEKRRLNGTGLSPRQSGENQYQDRTAVAVLLACKPAPDEVEALHALVPALTSDEIIAEREAETVIQFIMRSSLRNPDDDRDVTIYVYDHQQAESVERYLTTRYADLRYVVDVDHVDLVLERPTAGPTKTTSYATDAERKVLERRRDREKRSVAALLKAVPSRAAAGRPAGPAAG